MMKPEKLILPEIEEDLEFRYNKSSYYYINSGCDRIRSKGVRSLITEEKQIKPG